MLNSDIKMELQASLDNSKYKIIQLEYENAKLKKRIEELEKEREH